ncbi:unnamed protein product [Ilex paraguariensis]|uniref:NB-ARC domain-containing protein n=1 Tax=Ilex paraguariensis TaxID=185542 RepID=A0ABC8U2B5_9AQUA
MEELSHKFLINRRCHIVFDDVRTPEDWATLQNLLPTQYNGIKIMITTRNRNTVHEFSTKCFVLEKRALSDKEGWELFNVRVGFKVPTELENLGRTNVRRCSGLSWAIYGLGNELSKRSATQEQWYIWGFLVVLLFMVGFKSRQRLARLVGILSLTGQNCILPSVVLNFFTTFEPIGNQIKDLIQREIGMDQPVGDDGPLVGLEEYVQLLTSYLITNNAANRVVWIVGCRGIRKTTLAEKVYSSVRSHFDCHTWFSVPQALNDKPARLKIAIQLLLFEGKDKAKPIEELLHKLLINRRCLIVFDHVRTPKDWATLQKLLPAQYNGNKIMIITRNRNMVHEFSTECFVLEKRALSDEEGWELFNARVGFKIPTELKNLGRTNVRRCRGLHWAICGLGN